MEEEDAELLKLVISSSEETKLYESIMEYNRSIDELIFLGELRTKKHFQSANVERKKLHSDMEVMWKRLSQRTE